MKRLAAFLLVLFVIVWPVIAQKPTKPVTLTLAPSWNSQVPADLSSKELAPLLKGNCKAVNDINLPAGTPLFKDITFLMPASEAAKKLNKMPALRRPIAGAAFPRFSFFYHTLDAPQKNFERILLITDSTDRVIGVQLIAQRPRENVEDLYSYTREAGYRLYDFAQNLERAASPAFVRRHARLVDLGDAEVVPAPPAWQAPDSKPKEGEAITESAFIEINTTYYTPVNRDQYSSSSRFRIEQRTKLIFPRCLGNLILFRIENQLR